MELGDEQELSTCWKEIAGGNSFFEQVVKVIRSKRGIRRADLHIKMIEMVGKKGTLKTITHHS